MVICLERGANDLHMVQLTPLPPDHLLLHQNPNWFNLSGAGLPRLSWKKTIKQKSVSCIPFSVIKLTIDPIPTIL